MASTPPQAREAAEEAYLEELRAASRSGARLPDWFMVGHAKCGTTAMYRMLDAHRQIFMPVYKETQFLSRAPHERTEGPTLRPQTLDPYLELFAAAPAEQLAGEASTEYLRTPATAERIAALCPRALIITAFREPAAFLRSLHLQLLEIGIEDEPDLARALALEPERREGRSLPADCRWPAALRYSDHVRYSDQLRGYHERFGRERVMTVIYDDFRADNEGTMREILRFLGVDDSVAIEPAEANPTVQVRSRRAEGTLNSLTVGGGPLGRALRGGVRGVTSPQMRRRAIAFARRAAVQAPPPSDEELMASLRGRFAGEVDAFSSYLGRDLRGIWR
jgi:hypothetical protein